jgi:type IV secretion system protein VirD4
MIPARYLAAFGPLILMMASTLLPAIDWPHSNASSAASQRTALLVSDLLPYGLSAASGFFLLLAARASSRLTTIGWSVSAGSVLVIGKVGLEEALRLSGQGPIDYASLSMVDPAAALSAAAMLLCGIFATRIAIMGPSAFGVKTPRRVWGKRALHGDAEWMKLSNARKLFGKDGGIVVGECYRVDRDSVSAMAFRADQPDSWGLGGRSELLCFDGAFGSSHGLVFAGSGGFKTTSVTIPTALRWPGALIALDPSNEVAPMVEAHRKRAGRDVFILDPNHAATGFNVLDGLGRHGASQEEDIAALASWIMSESGRASGVRDDFFRATAQQLLTALIADVCLSGQVERKDQTLRAVRANLAEPEPKLRARLQEIHETTQSDFVRENVASFIHMTSETFSGVYANAIRETHWLSYRNYAALVSGSTFSTGDIAEGTTDVFIALDLKTLETHAGLARVIIGSLLNAIYSRDHASAGRVLFLLDEVARLGFMRILETARDAGRKYGITLMMLYQSIGQMRESFGGRDATSKWFESASWISFAAINDLETADYISRRCGTTTVEIDQISRSDQARGSSRTRSKQLASRPLILPHEVLLMRPDEQIVFTGGNPPLRCGRALWFRRPEMRACVGESRFHGKQGAVPKTADRDIRVSQRMPDHRSDV